MKSKLAEHFKRSYKEYLSVIILFALIFLALNRTYEFANLKLNIPIEYSGGDDAGTLVNAKILTEQNWLLTADRLGAPDKAEYYDFTTSMMHNSGLLVMKFFAMITGDAPSAMNLTFFFTFFLTGLISYFVMRELKISNWIAVVASAAFGVSPYMIMRGINHLVLTECYFIPLSVLLCFWIYERDDVFCLNKEFFKNKRNCLAIFFTLLIANNGIAYYPFFTCFMLLIVGISKLIKTKKFRYLLKSFSVVGFICAFVLLNLVPGVIYHISNGTNPGAVFRNGFVETEVYGLKLIQLILPVNSHGISLLGKVIDTYNQNSTFVNENMTSYITVLGIIGLVILVFAMFLKKNDEIKERLGMLSELNIMLLFLGTTGGLGTMFAFFVSDMIRGYNRISIMIEYVCIIAVALILDHLYKKYSEKHYNCNLKYAIVAIGILLCVGSLLEGSPAGYTPDYEAVEAEYQSDGDFVRAIEGQVPTGAKIYQLPYHPYPEFGPVNEMCDYDLFVGYIHSSDLRWSYGSIKGRETDQWNKEVSKKDYPEMVSYLKEQDFHGIYIDRRAYTADELKELEEKLTEVTGQKPMISTNKNLSFYNLDTAK